MPITVAWDNAEQTILRYDFEESWTLTEFAQVRRVGYDMIDGVSHQGFVGVLLVLPKRGVMPDNIITNALGQIRVKHPRTVLLALVTTNTFIKILYNTMIAVSRGAKLTMIQVDTIEEGRAQLLAKLQEIQFPKS